MAENWGEVPFGGGSGSVPSSSSSSDPGALIASLTGQGLTAAQMQQLANKAAIPVPGGSPQQMPASLLYNPQKSTPGQLDKSQAVGKGYGKAQGIGNSIIGAMNAIAAVKTGEDNKKKLQIATDTHTLLTEQNNIDQATQAMQALPQDAPERKQLQDSIDASKQRMNGILSDKKTADSIAKGFHIDFTDPQANNTLDHQGVKQGQQMAQETLSRADQFMQKAPAPLGPNVQAQARYTAAMQAQQMQQKTMQAFIPLVRAMMQSQTASDNREATFGREQYHEAMENARNMTTAQSRFQTALAQIQGRKDLAGTQFGYKMAEIGAEGNKQLDVFTQELTLKEGDPTKQIQVYEKFKKDSSETQAKMNEATTNAEGAKAAYLKQFSGLTGGKPDPQVVQDLDNQINAAKSIQKSYSDSVDATQSFYNKLAGVQEGGPSSVKPSANNPSGSAAASSYLGAPGDEDDDEGDDNNSGTN
jgi:hypothetical protein